MLSAWKNKIEKQGVQIIPEVHGLSNHCNIVWELSNCDVFLNFQFNYVDFKGQNQTFGPIFHADEFLLPLLELQEEIKTLEAEYTSGEKKVKVMLKDVCNNPLSRPDR